MVVLILIYPRPRKLLCPLPENRRRRTAR
jgi:hypothetical protein